MQCATAMQRQDNAWVVTAGEQSWTAPVVINAAAPGPMTLGNAGPSESGWCLVVVRHLCFPRRQAATQNTGPWSLAPAKTGTSSRTPDAAGVASQRGSCSAARYPARRARHCHGHCRIGEMTNLEIRPPVPGRGCARSLQTVDWWVDRTRRPPGSFGWRGRVATASRPARPWARHARRWCGGFQCHSTFSGKA